MRCDVTLLVSLELGRRYFGGIDPKRVGCSVCPRDRTGKGFEPMEAEYLPGHFGIVTSPRRNIKMLTGRLRVLLVEDDEDDYVMMRDLFSEIWTSGFDVDWAQTYESASQAFDSDWYDVCLLDYHLGEHNGIELLRVLRQKGCAVPVIIITGVDDYDVDREAMKAGAADYLVKDHLTKDLLERSIRYTVNRKRAEEALRESEARYRAIVEDQTELICRFMPDGAISFVNETYCCTLGRKREELAGCCFLSFIPREERENLQSILDSLTREDPVATCEYRVVLPDAKIRWQQWRFRRIFDGVGKSFEYQAVGRDITERKNMEEELREGAEKIKIFAYCISHDLKSPVVGVHGLTKLLKRQFHDVLNEKGRKYCDQILKASEQIAALVDEINVFIKTKEAPLVLEDVNLNEVLQMIKEEYAPQLEDREICWIVPEAVPRIRGDRLSILRALRNLVENAIKYGGKQLSEIRIGYEESEGSYILSVSDNGVGIKGENREGIFGPFQREPTSKGMPGLGLGLAIVKEIAERHNGTVWMEAAQERGTRFLMEIPRSARHCLAVPGPLRV